MTEPGTISDLPCRPPVGRETVSSTMSGCTERFRRFDAGHNRSYSGGVFSQVASSSISLSVFGNYSVYAITSIRLGAIGTDLAVQIENSFGFDSSGGSHSIDGVAVCTGNGEGTFSSPTRVTAFTGTLAGSVTLEGIDYLVSLNKGARTFGFWYYNAAKTAWSNAGGFSYSSGREHCDCRTAASGMPLVQRHMNGSTHIGIHWFFRRKGGRFIAGLHD